MVHQVAKLSIFLEAPKSASLTRPVLSTRMFAPLMSRCMIPVTVQVLQALEDLPRVALDDGLN